MELEARWVSDRIPECYEGHLFRFAETHLCDRDKPEKDIRELALEKSKFNTLF